MNQWGKLLNLMAAHPVLSAKRDAFLAALRAYLAEYFPERVALVDDVVSCEPNEYFVLNRMVGALMMPMESADRRFCQHFLREFFFQNIEDLRQKTKDNADYLLTTEDFSVVSRELFGFLGNIYFDGFLNQHIPEIIDFIEQAQDHLDEAILLDVVEQVYSSIAYQGKTLQFLERLNLILRRVFNRLGFVEFKNQGKKDTIFLFMHTVVWRDDQIHHAPTYILKGWIDQFRHYFERIVVIYELPFAMVMPAASYYSNSLTIPSQMPEQVEMVGLPKALSAAMLEDILCTLGMGKNSPMMTLGGNQFLATRIRVPNSYFFPMTQLPLLHSARVSLYYANVGTAVLAQQNIFGEPQTFMENSEGFAEKELLDILLPLEYVQAHHQNLSAGAIKILMVGYQLVTELLTNKDEFIAICRDIAAYRDVEVHCIGLMPGEFARLKLPEISGVQIFPYKATPHLKDLYLRIAPHFFLNPRRVGGGGGAYLALHLGIPVLAYEIGDVGVLMKNFYLMNERADFLEFIQNYLENADFRATINEVHRHYFARSRLSQSDCCRLLIRKMREIDASLQG